MARLEIGGTNGWHPEEIGVFGRIFTTRRVSRSVNRQMHELNERMRLATDDDEAFRALAELMDLLLESTEPEPKVEKGKRKPTPPPTAGELLREKWENDELFLDQIFVFSEQVQEAASRPPTQTPS